MWESQAAFVPDFSKRLRETTLFVVLRKRVISTAGLAVGPGTNGRLRLGFRRRAVATSFCCSLSSCRLSCAGLSK